MMSQSPTLPPIEPPELDILEVEPLPPPTVTQAQERQPGDALKHFRDVAMRVMTQVALGQDPFPGAQIGATSPDPEPKRESPGPNKKTSSKVTRMPAIGSPKKTGKTAQKVAWGNNSPRLAAGSPSKRRDPGRAPRKKSTIEPLPKPSSGGGNKFASLVRLARFRKMSFRKGDDAIKEEEAEEEEEALPVKPRFCASMSPEAQYAMLKGYEDMLITTLQTKVRADRREALYRVRTPHKQVQSLYLAHQAEEDTPPSEKIVPIGVADNRYGAQTTIPKIPSLANNHNTSLTRTSSMSGNLQKYVPEKAVPKDRQLRLTSRFERAQDILDSVRLSQGSLVTSPRALQKVPQGRKQKNPLDHYNAWSHAWAKEFKLQYGSPKQRLTIE